MLLIIITGLFSLMLNSHSELQADEMVVGGLHAWGDEESSHFLLRVPAG